MTLVKRLLIVVFLILLQLTLFHFFVKPFITTWGASKQEASMPMLGDNQALTIISTRAITINASPADVWQWLIQLGADRCGFYSYAFIENALGYQTRHQTVIQPEFKAMVVGDIVRGSIDESKSITPYQFRVLAVTPPTSFVLENWGTFLIKKVNDQQTRLIIRTQEAKHSDPSSMVASYVIVPLHYLMERRTLLGLKARVEAGANVPLSDRNDLLWFASIVGSALLIGVLVFIGHNVLQCLIMPVFFSTFWLGTLLVFNPVPWYSMGLLVVTGACLLTIQLKKTNETTE